MYTKKYLLLGLLLLLFTAAFQPNLKAQDQLNTFTLSAKTKTYTVSQDVPATFLGIYNSGKAEAKVQWNLTKEADNNLEWGALVQDGQFVTSDVMEYSGGKMVSYTAYTIIYKNNTSGKTGEAMLYEFEGKKFLDQAIKEEAVAENK
jgi:hypothetical protein